MNFEPIDTYRFPARFLYADVTYTGQPTVSMFIDNGPALGMNPSGTLPNSSTPKTVRLYYPTNTTGNTPHYTSTGSGFIENVTYEPISITTHENSYFNWTTYYLPKKEF